MRILYGREQEFQPLIDPANSVVLVTGDEGVGKSTLLSACRDAVQESQLANENITRLPHRTGGLQVSILNQLISIAAKLINDQNVATKAMQKFSSRARVAVGPRRKDFILAVAKELLSVVKQRVGSDTGQALGEFFTSVSTDNSESILETLHTRVDTDALQAVVDITSEVASINGSTLYLFFENAQNLSEEDLRQLADLPSMLPENVVVRIEHKDSSDEHRRRIRLLRSAGIIEVPLSGLTEDVVSFWCRTKNVPASLHKRIYHSTRGYPLFVDDAINQALTNRRIGGISPAENFRTSTVDSLNDLDSEAAAAARQLSAFIEPPPREMLGDLLGEGMTTARWEGVQSKLEQARIFTTSADGTPWFHEVRRRCIWESLSPLLRRETADRATDFIISAFRDTEDPELLVNLALIASDSSEVDQDPRAKHLSGASLDEIALLSSLLEIAEPTNDGPSPNVPTAFGDPVFDYCRQVFMEDVDAVSALESLTSAEIVFVAENDNAAVLIPRLSNLAYLLTLGRAGAELPRFPMPRIASVIFRSTISPRLKNFVTCSYGVGHPRLLRVVTDGQKLHKRERPHHPYGRTVHGVFFRASVEQQPFYAYSTFPDAEAATHSAQALKEASGRHWGLNLDVDWVLQLPTEKIRCRRFVNAFERIHFNPHSGLSFMQEVTKKADLLRYVRANCNRLERAVLDLEETISYVVLEKDQEAMVVEVTGGGDGVRKLDSSAYEGYRFSGPYRWANLRRMLNLRAGEGTGNITFGTTGATRYEPKKVLEDLSNKARNYNRHQPGLIIKSSEDALQKALDASAMATFHDAQALSAVLSQYGEVKLTPERMLLLICTQGEEGKYFDWQHSEAIYLEVPDSDLSHDIASVKVVDAEVPNFDVEIFGSVFSEELAQIPEVADGSRDWRMSLGLADPQFLISRKLGYEDREVKFLP